MTEKDVHTCFYYHTCIIASKSKPVIIIIIVVIFIISIHPWCREGGGVGDASIRKTAYFEGAQDPTLYGKVCRQMLLTCFTIAVNTRV